MKTKPKAKKISEVTFDLCLYVARQSANLTATSNLKKICNEHLNGRCRVEVIDLAKHPAFAVEHQIVAIPTLIRRLPVPIRKILGDLSNTELVVVGLDIREAD